METIFENDVAKLTYEEELKVLTITWTNKKMTFEEYQMPFKLALEFMTKKPVINYISDIRNQGIVSPDYRKWLQETALPEAAKAGLKRVVGVASVNVFKQYYINNVFQSAKKFGIPFKMFNNIEDAKKWFREFEK
ncbi:MAG: hypothetical protein HOO91_21265 [Bacteroidales bacterium]|nr:hypothetical protein [Bacteroidales bacterium]